MTRSITIRRVYTMPHTREGYSRRRNQRLVYEDNDMSPIEWAVELLRNFDATRHNWRAQYVGEEPQITDFARGEEMTVSAELSGFSEAEQFEIRQLLTA